LNNQSECYLKKSTLPPVDYSFQNAPLTSEGSCPSQMNRHRMAMVSQSKLVSLVKKWRNYQKNRLFALAQEIAIAGAGFPWPLIWLGSASIAGQMGLACR